MFTEMGFNAAVPLSLRFVIDRVLTPRDYSALVNIALAMTLGVLLVSAAGFWRSRQYAVFQSGILQRLRQTMFDHLQALSVASHARREPGEVLSRFSTDLGTFETAMVMAIPWGLQPLCEAIIASLLLLALDWRLALSALLLWPWTIFAPRRVAKRAAASSAESKMRESQLLGRLSENLAVQPMIKAFNLQSLMGSLFADANLSAAQSSRRSSYLTSVMERATTAGILVIQVAVFMLSARMAFQGSISVGTLVSFQGLLLILSNSLLYLMQFSPTFVQSAASVRRILQFLREPAGVTDLPDASPLPPFTTAIEMENVDFSYTGEQLNLSGINLVIPRGQTVAVVGGSGSGKSTALALLLRFYDPAGGAVKVDARPLTSVKQASLRAQIGVVFQDSLLLNISLRENIRLGKPDAGDEEIVNAAKAAEIHDAIMAMPTQYDTLAGERGGRLSGGQRQRIAIARAMLKDPAILLLDEATSALDPATETLINQTLGRLGEGRTVISVTHRLASVTGFDRIFVFASGHMVESGPHAELLAAGGVYAQLWARQSGFSIDSDGLRTSITPERLSAFPVFSELEPELLAASALLCRQSTWREGEDVFRQGDFGSLFYIIVRGRFQVIRDGRLLATLQDGDCFGEVALVTDRPRNATVRAAAPGIVLTLDRESFRRLLVDSPRTHERIMALLQARADN